MRNEHTQSSSVHTPETAGTAAFDLLYQRDGRLTRELLLQPAGFGLGHLPARQLPDATTRMVCGYCSTGCALNVHLRDGEAIGLTPATQSTVNLGMACPKGWEALTVLDAPDRATVPLLRDARGRFVPVDWDQALRTFVARIRDVQHRHGNESVAFLSTGQIPTEEMALLGALAKFGMGLLHGDGNTRQCMATAAVAYKESFGYDAPPYTYADFEESDVIVLVGSNLCITHPIMWEHVVRNRQRPEIVVIDPRTTETAMQATLHVPLKPKSDLVLFYGLARLLIERGWIDRDFIDAHTTGFEAFAQHVQSFPLERVVEYTGIPAETIERLVRVIADGQRVSFWWTMGVNQSYEGVRTAQSLINLALLTGNIGRPGTGANSITGQCNAMGSRLFSNTTNLFGGRSFENPEHRAEVGRILEIDPSRVPSRSSWAYHEILEGILQGKIRGLWVVATNPAHSWINQNAVRDILGRLDFLVVQDMYRTTETAQMADLVLPAAGWGEKEGTFINSERRLGVIKKVRRAPGQALADFAIFKLIAQYWGCGDLFRKWSSPAAVFQLIKSLSAGLPCDITGIADYAMLDECSGIQWPYPAGNPDRNPERRLFADGTFYHPGGRAAFCFDEPRGMPEPPGTRYPLLLLTGRGSVAQWHTQTRTRNSAILRQLYSAGPHVEIHPDDARSHGIGVNDDVVVESQRGSLIARACITPTVRRGQIFLPMHDESTNQLTDAVFDPISKQPSYKACAVRICRAS